MRDLANRPIPRPRRERTSLLARRDIERSRIRCSWRLGLVRFQQAPPQADDGHGGSQKNADGPSLRQHHPPNPTFHARCPTRNEEALHRPWGCRRTRAERRRRTIARLACSQIHEEPLFFPLRSTRYLRETQGANPSNPIVNLFAYPPVGWGCAATGKLNAHRQFAVGRGIRRAHVAGIYEVGGVGNICCKVIHHSASALTKVDGMAIVNTYPHAFCAEIRPDRPAARLPDPVRSPC
jgi:hypothetical protein